MSEERSRGSDGKDLELLEEIEGQNVEQVARQRLHDRVAVRTKVILRPGNSSQVRELKIQGLTGDLSGGGCRALFPVPVMVGDIYRLEFDIDWLEAPLVLARCLRCRLVKEDVFETGFQFFNPIDLNPARRRNAGNDLLD